MLIIAKEPAANGGYSPIQTWTGQTPPDTHYQIRDGLDTSVFTEYNGFVILTVIRGIVTAMEPNTEAWEAWKETLSPDPGPEPEPDPGQDMSAYATWDSLAAAWREGVNSVE